MNSARALSKLTNGSRSCTQTFSKNLRIRQIDRCAEVSKRSRGSNRVQRKSSFAVLIQFLTLLHERCSRSVTHCPNRLWLLELEGSSYGGRNGSFHRAWQSTPDGRRACH